MTGYVANPKRGCGYLKPGAMYLRSMTSPDGLLPPFVWFAPAMPYNEPHFRGYVAVNGLQWESALQPKTVYPEGVEQIARDEGYESYDHLYAARWEKYSGGQPAPATELQRHLGRLRVSAHGLNGILSPDLGHQEEMWTRDLLMWVGETYYETPEAFVAEGLKHGFNKRIRANASPPGILPGRTKLYLAHMKTLLEDGTRGPGLFGCAYLSEIIYTMKPGDTTPKYVEQLDGVETVYIGPQGGKFGDDDEIVEDGEEMILV